MRPRITIFIASIISVCFAQPTFLNGNFEINTHPVGACNFSYLNMSNAMWNSTVSFSNAYGASESLDLMHTTCTWGPAQNGTFFAGVDFSNGNAFTLTLSAPLTAGTTYTISFWDKGDPCCPPAGPMQIGLSTVNNATGTVIYTGVPSTIGIWNNRVFSFVAPFAAQYISVQGTSGAFWSNVDNFTFQTPLPAEIMNYEANRTGNQTTQIIWETDHPENYSTWYLDRSSDGIHFVEVRETQSIGGVNSYTFNDSVSLLLPKVFYRLRGKDLAGNILAGNTIELNMQNGGAQPVFQVFPNPVGQDKHLSIYWIAEQDGPLTISVTDLTGRQVFAEERYVFSGHQEIEIAALQVPSGCYLLRIGSASQKITVE